MEDKKEIESITSSVSKEVNKILDEGHYNKSKLIDSLLTKHFQTLAQKDKK